MSWYDQLVGLFVFFTILNTISVGLRLFVRTRLTKGSFGWDDAALVFTYVSAHYPLAILHSLGSYLDEKELISRDI